MIRYKDKRVVAYVGDHKPANVYHGTTAVALANKKTGSGQNNEFRTEYKTQLIKRIVGQSVQESGTKKAAHVMGKTKKYNQLLSDANNNSWHYIGTPTVDDQINTRTVTITANNTYAVLYCYKNMPAQTTQYFIFQVYDAPNGITYAFKTDSQIIGDGLWGDIFKSTKDSVNVGLRFRVNHGVSYDIYLTRMFVNLTEMYGAGNEPTTIAQFLSDYPAYNSYVPYTTGSLSSVELNDVTYCGENLWGSPSEVSVDNTRYATFQFLKPLKKGTYTISANVSNSSTGQVRISLRNSSRDGIATFNNTVINGKIERTFEIYEEAYFAYMYATESSSIIGSVKYSNINLVKGNEAKPYIPYNGQTIPFSTPVTLNGIATQDEIYSYVDNGYLVTKKVERYYKLTITEDVIRDSSLGWREEYFAIRLNKSNSVTQETIIISDASTVTRCLISSGTVYAYFSIDGRSMTLSEWRNYIIGKTIVYPLATPTITEISRVPITCDFDDVTNIIVSNESAGLADPDTSYSMDPVPTPYIPSEIVSSSKIDIQHNNHYYEIDGLTEKWNQLATINNYSFSASIMSNNAVLGSFYFDSTHKYVAICMQDTTLESSVRNTFNYVLGGGKTAYQRADENFHLEKGFHSWFFKPIESAIGNLRYWANSPNTNYSITNCACHDLTDIFGAGSEPTSIDDPRIQRLIEIAKQRPQYDEGSLLSASKIYDQDDNLIYDLDEPIRSAGNIHDVLCSNGQVKVNMGDVDLGTLNWSYGRIYGTEAYCFYSDLPNSTYNAKATSANVLGNIICEKYPTIYAQEQSTNPNYFGVTIYNGWGYTDRTRIIISDNSFTDAASFKAAMSGVVLIYELAEPTTRQAASVYFPAGLTFHDEYGRSLTSTYKEEILTDVIDIESSGIGTATDEIWVNRASTNLWDEEWRLVYGAYVTNTNRVIVEEKTYYTFIASASYWIDVRQLDADGVQISASSKVANTPFKTEIGCKYIRFYMPTEYGTTYNHDIAFVEGKTGTYEPYAKGKVISIKRIGSVDLGTLDWTVFNNCFASIYRGIKNLEDTNVVRLNIVCTKYSYILSGTNSSTSVDATPDKSISFFFNPVYPRIVIKDTSYTDAAAFKSAMSGTMLYYELANPVITDITNTELGQKLLAKTYQNANHRISIDLGSIDVQWFEAK